jgi:hypothetical protein
LDFWILTLDSSWSDHVLTVFLSEPAASILLTQSRTLPLMPSHSCHSSSREFSSRLPLFLINWSHLSSQSFQIVSHVKFVSARLKTLRGRDHDFFLTCDCPWIP